MDIKMPKTDSATWRGAVTSVQGFVAAVVLLLGGLIATIKGVPGCGEAIVDFVYNNWLLISGAFGLSTGVASFLFNFFFRKNVKTI